MESKLKGKKILFTSAPADGHFNPLTGLAVYLQQIGCDVRWYGSPIFTEKLKKLDIPHYPFVKALDVNSVNLTEVFPQRSEITDTAAKFQFDLINVFGDRSVEYLEDITNIHRLFAFDLMIADSFFSGIPFIKHQLNVPVVAVGIVPLAEDSIDLAPYGMGLLPPVNEAERQEYANLRTLVKTAIFKDSIDRYSAMLDQYHISHEKSILFDLLIRQADLYLQIGAPGFEYERSDVSENVHYVGALMGANTKTNEKPWFDERLNTYKKIVLVTEGTVETDMNKLVVPTLEAFKDSDVLVIATTSGHQTAELQQRFPYDNLIIEDYILFDALMPFVHVYITNGGFGGTLLSIRHKLPMVTAGVHEAKNEICSRVGYFNYGVDLKTETPEPRQIKEAVEEVLSNKLYRNNVTQLAAELNSYDAIPLSVSYISDLIAEEAGVLQTKLP